MGGRYYISGVQIGMLRAFAKQEDETDIKKLLNKIEKEQYISEKEEFNKKFKKR